ncbi:MAG TPA: hypothetical protein VMC06_10760 [Opitutaceae bacterium]|nr:hypothetical protein [Opitutaceae bacterium]
MYFVVAFALLLHALFWGAGLAWMLTPRRWRRFWPVFAPLAGLALQSVVVWGGAYAGLVGTNSYARYTEALPLVLLVLSIWRRYGAWWTEVRQLGAVWLAMAACLAALVWPLSHAAPGLTTASLGSCDAADYAAGARVLQEFARSDRTGFMGQTEVVRVQSVDNFYDFWLRLNHFTPSALIAFDGTIFDCVPYEITGLVTASLLALSLPLVFWLARAVLGYPRWWAVAITVLYGMSPVTWYAVYQVAPGQLLAAQAIAVITWAGVALWRAGARGWRRGLAFGGLLVAAYGLLLGSYNFIVLVCLVPALAYAGGQAAWTEQWGRFLRWLGWMLAPLAVAGLLFFERVAGLAERFRLFQQYDFGWHIPALTPEGWLGLVSGPSLNGWSDGVRLACSLLVLWLLGWSLLRASKARCTHVFLAVCLAVPVLIGYGFLNLRGVQLGTNASYDAYKLFSVFFPGLLVALCYWVTLAPASPGARRLVLGFALLVAGGNALTVYRFGVQMYKPPLIVDRPLLDLRQLEARPEIASVNMRIPDFWARLWANSFLLRKPQYFLTHTYEGRLNTELKGEWDINGSLLQVILPEPGDYLIVNNTYTLVRTGSSYFVRAYLSDGWYDVERELHPLTRWRWSKGDAVIEVENPHNEPVRLVCRFNARSLVDRDLQVWLNGRRVRIVQIGTAQKIVRVPEIVIPPGHSQLQLRSKVPPTAPGGYDKRLLGFAVYGIDLEVRPDEGDLEP